MAQLGGSVNEQCSFLSRMGLYAKHRQLSDCNSGYPFAPQRKCDYPNEYERHG
jgi:hypothetical protein